LWAVEKCLLGIHKLRTVEPGADEEAVIVDLIGEACLDSGKKRKVFQRKIIVFTIGWMRIKYCC